MNSVAYRATRQALTQEQQKTTMPSKGDPPAAQKPAFIPPATQPELPAKRSTLHLPHTARRVPVEGKAQI